MKTKIKFVVLLCGLLAVTLTGCQTAPVVRDSVPVFNLQINPATHQVSLSNPKDTTIKNFKTSVTAEGGTLVEFESLTTAMNPDVITTTAEGQTTMIKAQGEANAAAFKAGLEGAADVVGKLKL